MPRIDSELVHSWCGASTVLPANAAIQPMQHSFVHITTCDTGVATRVRGVPCTLYTRLPAGTEKKSLRREAFQPCREAWLMRGLG